MSPQTHRLISVDILTPSFRIVGKVVVESTGLAGHLNNPDTSFLEVIDAHMARIHMPTKLAYRFEMLRMTKERIFAICVQRRADLGPRRIVQGGFQDIHTYPVHLATPIYELSGELEVSGRFNFPALMVEGQRDFIPLYNGHLIASLIPSLLIESEALLFNRSQVDWLGLDKDRIEE